MAALKGRGQKADSFIFNVYSKIIYKNFICNFTMKNALEQFSNKINPYSRKQVFFEI
jgi:hypothetical protein